MDYLDYVQMTKSQQIAYKVKSFFTGIPNAIKTIFMYIGYFFKNLFVTIANGFKGYGQRFAAGDGATKLSYIIMGAGNMAHKQLMKGVLFLAAEVAYIYFMMSFGMTYVSKVYSFGVNVDPDNPNVIVDGVVGNVPIRYEVDPIFGNKIIANADTADDSNKVLLFFVLTLMISIAFFVIYIANTKSAYATQEMLKEGIQPVGFVDEMKTFLDERYHITLLTLPIFLLMVFNILPIIFTIFMAFTNYDKNHNAFNRLYWWVGFENFADVFYNSAEKSQTFGKVLVWTLIWAVFATFSNYILGIVLALLINKKDIKYKGFWRTMFVITSAVPQFVTLLVMRLLLDNQGIVNAMMGTNIRFLADEGWAKVSVIVVNMWIGIPYTMLSVSGILMNIPEDLYESARIDGANAVQQFTKITLPYISFVMTPYLISTFVGNINNFNVIFFLTGGAPESVDYYSGAGTTDLLVTWLYKLTVSEQDYKLASVIGIIVFVLCATGSLITFNMSKATKNEEEFS